MLLKELPFYLQSLAIVNPLGPPTRHEIGAHALLSALESTNGPLARVTPPICVAQTRLSDIKAKFSIRVVSERSYHRNSTYWAWPCLIFRLWALVFKLQFDHGCIQSPDGLKCDPTQC